MKPFDKTQSTSPDSSLVARVLINYEANCRLDPKEYGNSNEAQEVMETPRGDFMTRMKKISKVANQGDKENTNYLDEVEKNILGRRKGGPQAGSSTDKNYSSRNFLATTAKPVKNTVPGRGALSKTSHKKLPLGQSVTPESLYNTYNTEKGSASEVMPTDEQLMGRMANELNMSRQKIMELQNKLKALEEGQMTVDNLEFSKKLDGEREALNGERLSLLKEYAAKADLVEKERQRLEKEKNTNVEENLRDKAELDSQRKELELQKLQQKALDDDMAARRDALVTQEAALRKQQKALEGEKKGVEEGQQELADYRVELEELKDRLLKERERLQQDKARAEGEREGLEHEIKALKTMKDGLEKEREKELKDVNKRKRELEMEEDRVKREGERVKNEDERVKRDKYRAEEEIKKYKTLCDDVEDEKLKLWQDRNSLNKEIKQFIEDRKSMESDLKWRQKELEQVDEELQEEAKQLEKQAEELEEFELELEAKQNDLEARESLLLHEREDFSKLKLKFMDGLIESGGLAHLTPELKQMAKNMGINVDELEQEKSKIESRKKEIEKLQKQHEDQMREMAAKGSKTTSRRGSISGGIGRRASIALGLRPNLLAGKTFVNNKLTVESFLNDLYDNVLNNNHRHQLNTPFVS